MYSTYIEGRGITVANCSLLPGFASDKLLTKNIHDFSVYLYFSTIPILTYYHCREIFLRRVISATSSLELMVILASASIYRVLVVVVAASANILHH